MGVEIEATSRKANAMNNKTESGVAGRSIVPSKVCFAKPVMPAGRQDAAAVGEESAVRRTG